MKTKKFYPLSAVLALLTIISSCKKEDPALAAGNKTNEVASAGAIAVGTVLSSSAGVAKDSLYIVNCYRKDSKRDTLPASALPAAVNAYLAANYAGSTFKKAYQVIDPHGNGQYIVVITLNGNPVGLKFSFDGTFVNVLEQRAGSDLKGEGWHPGGPFCNRDGKRADTVALTALPAAVTSFFKTTYPSDTLLHAHRTPDSSAFVLISKNNTLFTTVVTKSGSLVKRFELTAPGKPVSVEKTALPAAILTYLDTTYPAYVFNKAFVLGKTGSIQGYDVFITANSTNFVVEFGATGAFVKARVIR